MLLSTVNTAKLEYKITSFSYCEQLFEKLLKREENVANIIGHWKI